MTSKKGQKDTTLVGALKRLAEEDPDREAFVFVDKFDDRISLSRRDVWDQSRKFAAMLKRHGIEKGDVVCSTLVNSPQRLISIFGIITAGAISLNGDIYLANGDDLFHNLRTVQCKAIILDESENTITPLLNKISYKHENNEEVLYQSLPYLKTLIKIKVNEENEDTSSNWFEEEDNIFEEEDILSDDICLIFQTTGTTGYSKEVPQTHRRMVLESSEFCERWGAVDGDVLYSDRSLGWFCGYPHLYISYGNKVVLTNRTRGVPEDMPRHMLKVFEKERCNLAILTGIEMERIMNKLTNPLPRLLKTVLPIGGHLVASIRRAAGILSHNVCVCYGGTEFGFVSSFIFGKDDYVENFLTGSLREGVEIKILDDNLEAVEKGQTGEIFVRSPMVAGEYYNNPQKTEEAFLEGGWFRTNDFGFQDEKGRLYVLGRKANVVKRGDACYYTAFLEARFLKCPGIKDLQLIGVPDPLYFEEFCLCATKTAGADLTEDVVIEFCKEILINEETSFHPKYVLLFDEFPRNRNMKVDRASLKAKACQRLGIELYKK